MAVLQAWGFVFVGIAGTLLHFLFDWTGSSWVIGLFSAVNESVWEHMKLLFYPWLLFSLWESRDCAAGFWQIKLSGILAGLILIPTLYYTYTGMLGVSADWFNIAIFFLAAGLVFLLETRRFSKPSTPLLPRRVAVGVLALMAGLFTLFTFLPPHIPLFADPVTGSYGFP